MPRVRKIKRIPDGKNYYVIDANFLSNKFIPLRFFTDPNKHREKDRVSKCMDWWKEIDSQVKKGKGRIYIPDVCIAEAFKVLAKKYYEEKIFPKAIEFTHARNKMSKYIRIESKHLKLKNRNIRIHDIAMCRDIIISVDRFFEMFCKKKKFVQIVDLLVIATAKYLIDFFDIPKENLHIITLDRALYEGSRKMTELPLAYDPTDSKDSAVRVFK